MEDSNGGITLSLKTIGFVVLTSLAAWIIDEMIIQLLIISPKIVIIIEFIAGSISDILIGSIIYSCVESPFNIQVVSWVASVEFIMSILAMASPSQLANTPMFPWVWIY